MSNDDLERSVADELYWDPKVDNGAIAVSAEDGAVTLRGTVGSFRQKREATQDAERIFGVKSVNNELEVRILNQDRRDDADLRGDVLQALMLDGLVPSTIDAKVDDGVVTLTGTANWQFQRDEAEFVASNILGVDLGRRRDRPRSAGAEHRRRQALHQEGDGAQREARRRQRLGRQLGRRDRSRSSGTVSSWSDHDEAVDAAWAAPGVTDVKDHILVAY